MIKDSLMIENILLGVKNEDGKKNKNDASRFNEFRDASLNLN